MNSSREGIGGIRRLDFVEDGSKRAEFYFIFDEVRAEFGNLLTPLLKNEKENYKRGIVKTFYHIKLN